MAHEQDKRTVEKRARKRLMVRFTPETGGATRTAFTGNLSANGVLLKTHYVQAPGTILSVEIQSPDTIYHLTGRVVWVKRSPARLAQVTSSSMGIYFKEPSPEWSEFAIQWKATG